MYFEEFILKGMITRVSINTDGVKNLNFVKIDTFVNYNNKLQVLKTWSFYYLVSLYF